MKIHNTTWLAIIAVFLCMGVSSQDDIDQADLPMDSESLQNRLQAIKIRWAESQMKQWDEDEDGEISKDEYVHMSVEIENAQRSVRLSDSEALIATSEVESEPKVTQESDSTEKTTVELQNEAKSRYEKRFELLDEDENGNLTMDELLAELSNQFDSSTPDREPTANDNDPATRERPDPTDNP